MPSERTPAPVCPKEEAPSQPRPSCKRQTHFFLRKHSPDRPVGGLGLGLDIKPLLIYTSVNAYEFLGEIITL